MKNLVLLQSSNTDDVMIVTENNAIIHVDPLTPLQAPYNCVQASVVAETINYMIENRLGLIDLKNFVNERESVNARTKFHTL